MKLLTLAILSALSAGAHATDPASSDTPAPTSTTPLASSPEYLKPTTLDTLKVVGQRLFPYQEGMVLNERYIQDQAKGNSDIGTLLRINPNVQFDDSAFASSNRMGEIRPANISINGGQYYQNLLQLDGTSFNNDIDPQATNPHDLADVPSATQGIALDTELIGQLTVYDSNVPAAFGGFSGGVVDAESRKARDTLGGKVSFRMSRSVWNEMILPEGDDISQSSTYANQPVYDKYRVSAMLEGRTGGGLGWIANVIRTRSDIPLRGYSAGQVSTSDELIKEQRRENTSASVRMDWAGNGITLSGSFTHAPTDERYFTQNARNSYFDLKQGGPVGSLRVGLDVGAWGLDQVVSYSDLDSSRRVPDDVDYWKAWARSPDYDWGVNNSSFEGNWGNIDQRNRTVGYALTARRGALAWGESRHALQFGLQYRDRLGTYHRLNDHYSFLSPGRTTSCTDANGAVDTDSCSLSPVYTTVSGTGGVVAGQGQFFRTRNIYSAGYFEVKLREWGLFAEDDIRLGRWSFRPGIRVDGDNLMDKTTVAPRFAMSWDVLGNQDTLLTAGANRYYGRSFFTYKLREGRDNLQTTYTRTAPSLLWSRSRTYTANNRFETLDIPYSDELNLGINQRLAGLDFNLKHVRRDGRDEILRRRVASDDTSGYYSANVYEYVNAGRSRSDTSTLSVGLQRPFTWRGSETHAQFAFDHTEVLRNYVDYESGYTDNAYNRLVRYEGSVIHAYDLPQASYNRPWTARLSTQTRLPAWGLMWSNFLRYRAGFAGFTVTGAEQYQDETIDVIERYDAPRTFTWDTTLEYSLTLPRVQEVYVRVEAMNVFNRRNPLSGSIGTTSYYEPGRSYWLELGYRF